MLLRRKHIKTCCRLSPNGRKAARFMSVTCSASTLANQPIRALPVGCTKRLPLVWSGFGRWGNEVAKGILSYRRISQGIAPQLSGVMRYTVRGVLPGLRRISVASTDLTPLGTIVPLPRVPIRCSAARRISVASTNSAPTPAAGANRSHAPKNAVRKTTHHSNGIGHRKHARLTNHQR